MKKLSIILISTLVALSACTKSKEVHPGIGDGNDEIVMVGMKDVQVEYTRTDHAELSRVVFHYSLADANGNAQQFDATEMTKKETFFELTLEDLLSDTLYWYYYELFSNVGDAFNTIQKTFHTQAFEQPEPPTPPSGVPEGAINGLFTINENGDQVYFSQGNLQYQASTNTWRFAEHQWDYVGNSEKGTVFENGIKCDNALISSIYDGWIDLFGWGTSGYNHGAVCWQPWSTGAYSGLYNVYGFSDYNLYDQTGEADWGYNAIYNGGNQENSGWRTLTIDELDYLFNNRNTVSGIRYAKAKVNGIDGIVVLPDDWNSSYYPLDNINGGGTSFDNNTISISQWETLEQYGAGFLPITGNRHGTGIIHNSIYSGYYWSASCDYNDNDGSYFIVFHESIEIVLMPVYRGNGFAVRLAKNAFSQPSIQTPTVITSDVSSVTSNSAHCGAEVTNDGGAEVTERGICWSTNANPTISDSHVSVGTGIGSFSATMTGLQASTTYHIRAYATNEAGTAYGSDREFTTLAGGGGSGVPEGAINGLFTINENGDQVYFSKGNLQYQASTNTWRFAENQWNYVGTQHLSSNGFVGGNVEGSDNNDASANYSGWIDLFNWGTSGYNHGANKYHPWDYGGDTSDYLPYGCDYCNLFDHSGQADWGYNNISNGGNIENQWRTLTVEEWSYLMNDRSTNSGIRFAKAKVNEVNGLILFPDGWDDSIYDLNEINQSDTDYNGNIIVESVWKDVMQYNGAVFLPAGGYRQRGNNQVDCVGWDGVYWSSTSFSSTSAYLVFVSQIMFDPESHREFWFSNSVRLVQDAN